MPRPIFLGTFAQGEIPPPLEHTFRTSDGGPWDLDGWTVLGFKTVGSILAGVPTISGTDRGVVTYTWLDGDTDIAGSHLGYIWVESDDGAVRLSSGPIHWNVDPALLIDAVSS